MSKRPKFEKPDVSMIKNEKFKVKTSQIPPMDVAFSQITLTDYELLVATIRKLNELIAMTNSYTEFIEKILEWVVNDGLEAAVLEKLNVWLSDGTLENLINDTLFKRKLDREVFEEFINGVYNIFVSQTTEDISLIKGEIIEIKEVFEEFINDVYNIFVSQTTEDISLIKDEIIEIKEVATIIKPSYSKEKIQDLIDNNKGVFVWLKGEYLFTPLFFRSNQVHNFNPDVLIRSVEGFEDGERLLNVNKCVNLVLNFNNAHVKMRNELPNQHGGNKHCLTVNGSENVNINDVILSDSGGDGLYIGHSQDNEPSINISVNNLVCLNNARQGISITDVKGCYINNVLIDGVRGGDPASGIDIEPNNPGDFIQDIIIENVVIKNTDNAGVLLALPYLASNPNSVYPDKYNEVSITLRNFNIENTKMGIHFYHLYKKIGGFINIENFNIKNTTHQGIVFDGWYKDMIPNLDIDGLIIDNVNLGGNTVAYESSGVVLHNEITREDRKVGGFTITNMEIKESNSTKKMNYSIYGQNLKNEVCELNLLNTRNISTGLKETILFKGLLNYNSSINKINQDVDVTTQILFNLNRLTETITKNTNESVTYIASGGYVGNVITFINNSDGVLKLRAVEGMVFDELKNISGEIVENYVSKTKGGELKVKMINETTFAVISKIGVWVIE